MKYFFDTEFIANNNILELISIGIVAEDGREYYAVSSEFNLDNASTWVKNNVICLLEHEKTWKWKEIIKSEIKEFLRNDENIEFYGWFSAYDWVLFCQLFGNMMTMPENFPHRCNDLAQTWHDLKMRFNFIPLPSHLYRHHHALDDDKWIRDIYDVITDFEK